MKFKNLPFSVNQKGVKIKTNDQQKNKFIEKLKKFFDEKDF